MYLNDYHAESINYIWKQKFFFSLYLKVTPVYSWVRQKRELPVSFLFKLNLAFSTTKAWEHLQQKLFDWMKLHTFHTFQMNFKVNAELYIKQQTVHCNAFYLFILFLALACLRRIKICFVSLRQAIFCPMSNQESTCLCPQHSRINRNEVVFWR